MNTILLPSKPSDLIERIVTLRLLDPANPQLSLLVEREHDLLGYTGIFKQSDALKVYVDKLMELRDRLQKLYADCHTAKHALFNGAANPNSSAQELSDLIKKFKVADQAYITTKTEIDSTVSLGIDAVV